MTSDYTVAIHGIPYGFSVAPESDETRTVFEWDREIPDCPHCQDWLSGTQTGRAYVRPGDGPGEMVVYCPSCMEGVGEAKENRR